MNVDIARLAKSVGANDDDIRVELVAERRGTPSPGGVLPNGKPDPNDPPDDGLLKAEHVRVQHGKYVFEVDTEGRTYDQIEAAILDSIAKETTTKETTK